MFNIYLFLFTGGYVILLNTCAVKQPQVILGSDGITPGESLPVVVHVTNLSKPTRTKHWGVWFSAIQRYGKVGWPLNGN